MRTRLLAGAALAALPILSSAVLALPATEASLLALPIVSPSAPATVLSTVGAIDDCAPSLATVAFVPAPPGRVRLKTVTYQPRSAPPPHGYGPGPKTFGQFHGGFFDPEGAQSNGTVFGFRGGVSVSPNVQLGGEFDWHHRGSRVGVIAVETPGPGGETIVTYRDFGSSSSDLLPFLGFLQVSGGDKLPLIPYAGLAGGYELLYLSGYDSRTGTYFDATYGGWGWQTWVGLAVPLSGHARISAEGFFNGAEVSREFTDLYTGLVLQERVNLDGVGMRFGLAFGF